MLLLIACALLGCDYVDEQLEWAQGLKTDDVVSIEAIEQPSPENAYYRQYDLGEFERIVAIVNEAKGSRLYEPQPVDGGTFAFYITTADAERHTFVNSGNTYLIIDGVFYDVDTHWFARWGDGETYGPVPEDFKY